MKIAVAGASGRLGRRFLLYCIKNKLPATALVRSKAPLGGMCSKIPCTLADYSDARHLEGALEGFTHIINITGSTDTTLSEQELFEANVLTTRALLEAAPKNLERFIHISSISVYGKRANAILNESSSRKAHDAYSKTKLMAEKEVLSFSKKFKTIILQPAIIYGPTFTAGFYAVLKAIKKKKMKIIGNGKNHFPLVHCDDVSAAIAKACKSDVQTGSAFLLVQEPQITQIELLQLAAAAMGEPEPKEHILPIIAKLSASASAFFSSLAGEKPSLTPQMVDQLCSERRFSSQSARERLGWKSAVSFKTGVCEVVKEFLEKK